MGCSFTGHRAIEYRHRERIRGELRYAIAMAYENGLRTFFSGGALGFDIIAADEVIRAKDTYPDIRLVMLIPCADQDRLWTYEQKREYSRVLSLADEVVYISDKPYFDGCMRLRNEALVDRCKMLIAYVGRSRSGAAQTMRMAEARGKIVHNIFPLL